MSIIIGADLVPTESNYCFFENSDIESLICNQLSEILALSNYRIFNLEIPFTDIDTPIIKKGPNHIAPIKCIAGIKSLGADLLTLANNHILDQGTQGLASTISALESNNISYLGAGENLNKAKKPFVLEYDNKKIGVYACAENEFTIASETKAGANPFDPLESLDDIHKLKNNCDYVIVLYHGGKEHYRYPSPGLQRCCRKMVEKGADLVVCQHSHCIGCEEKYQNGTIVYGQGNFLFDAADDEYWATSLLIRLDLDDKVKIEYIPICKAGSSVRLANDDEKKKILDDFNERSHQINDIDFVKNKYREFSKKMLDGYIGGIYGTNIIYRIINKLCGHRLNRKLPEKKILSLINYTQCEAHRELLTEALNAQLENNS